MTVTERCDVCSRKPENGYEGRCSHVDCPYRPVAWSDDEHRGQVHRLNGEEYWPVDDDTMDR